MVPGDKWSNVIMTPEGTQFVNVGQGIEICNEYNGDVTWDF